MLNRQYLWIEVMYLKKEALALIFHIFADGISLQKNLLKENPQILPVKLHTCNMTCVSKEPGTICKKSYMK